MSSWLSPTHGRPRAEGRWGGSPQGAYPVGRCARDAHVGARAQILHIGIADTQGRRGLRSIRRLNVVGGIGQHPQRCGSETA
eukprot:6260168-Pyramimonas_sp.AAC.1